MAHVKMHNLIKIEDWFKDESTIVRTLRKGKGRTPFTDSLVKLRVQISVNGEKPIVNNYPEQSVEMEELQANEESKQIEVKYDFETSENLRGLNQE